MEDKKIVELYWERSETAISETQEKYGRYCHHIAMNILSSFPDAEECVNDTWVSAWNSIPPQNPQRLSAYLGKITRNLALNRIIKDSAQKRAVKISFVLDEVEEFLPDPVADASLADEITLKDAINRFLATLPASTRSIFLRRYWYLSSIKEIAKDYRMSESNVKVILHRTRAKFKTYLEKEGIQI